MSTEPDRIAAHETITDHESEGIALLAEQFRGKVLLEAIPRAWLRQFQDIEDAAWALLVQSAIDAAEGAQLDQIGELVLAPRGTLDDASYRAVLRATIRARKSSGTPEDVIEVAGLALGAVEFDYREGAASVVIEPRAEVGYDAAALIAVLRLAKPAGVQIQAFDPPRAETELFTFASDGLLCEADAARGFGDAVDGTAGGRLTSVRE